MEASDSSPGYGLSLSQASPAGPPGGGDAELWRSGPRIRVRVMLRGRSRSLIAGVARRLVWRRKRLACCFSFPGPPSSGLGDRCVRPPPSPGQLSVASSVDVMRRALASSARSSLLLGAPPRPSRPAAETVSKAPTSPVALRPLPLPMAGRAKQARSKPRILFLWWRIPPNPFFFFYFWCWGSWYLFLYARPAEGFSLWGQGEFFFILSHSYPYGGVEGG